MKEREVIEIFERCGALLKGHFKLSSGLHSAQYLQSALVLQYPSYACLLGKEIAGRFADRKIEVVVAPALGGIIIAYETARFLNARALFAEREETKMGLRRGFDIKEGERVLIVEDVITTGGSVKELVDLIEEKGGEVEGVGAIVDRSGGEAFKEKESIYFQALVCLKIDCFPPSSCPLCRKGIPLVKPGSRKE
ncbi:MAG: orotate phosphoribosyltransferase [Candidatus Omnitrophota bacterium]|nr:MAG: orotate phosphoribosyltransferase [Candidatus Omnitrophota bacterium]